MLAWSADPAATVVLLTGHAVVQSAQDATVRTLTKGATLASGDTVSTDAGSYANLKMADGGFFILRPLTKFQIEKFAMTPGDAQAASPAAPRVATAAAPVQRSQAFFRLLRGGFRALSGLIGKGSTSDYRVSTAVATIGIRGTDFIGALCGVECLADPVMAGLPPDATDGKSLVVGDVSGEITVNAAGASVLGANKYGLITPQGKFYPLPGKPGFIAADSYIGADAKTPASCL